MIDRVHHILSESGPIAAALGNGFEPRPEQIKMAEAVVRAMQSKSHLLAEAATGVGKSFAYLVPAMLRAMEGETVVIATHTISLQEQLIEKDIPFLREALCPGDSALDREDDDEDAKLDFDGDGQARALPRLRPVLVKGRGNYVSIRRLKLASKRQDKLFADPAARRSLHQIEDWAMGTHDGTLSSLPPVERMSVWDKVESDSGNCMGRKCEHYRDCFYQRARRRMEQANLLICNHAVFFSDLALRAREVGFLPRYHHVVLDEGHTVEDVASDHFGLTISEGRVFHLLSTLYQSRSGKGYLPQLQLISGKPEMVDGAIRLAMRAEDAARVFFDRLLDERRRLGGAGRVRSVGVVENTLTPAFNELSLRLKMLREDVKNEADRYELNSYSVRAADVAAAAAVLVDQAMPGCAYWIDAADDDDYESTSRRKIALACAPVEVGPLLKERLFSGEHSVTLTSATLATRSIKAEEMTERAETAFSHALTRLGCEGADTLQLGSPFDYARQVEFIVDPAEDPRGVGSAGKQKIERRGRGERGGTQRDGLGKGSGGGSGGGGGPSRQASGPTGSERVDDDVPALDSTSPTSSLRHSVSPSLSYPDSLTAKILHHVKATHGGAFVLFTSFQTLFAVADRLRVPLEKLGIPLLVQGRDGSRTVILQRFRENEHSVLLGAASFWQGVDVRGRGLRNVIITKLPFDPPDRPLTEARGELIKQRGGDPFAEDALPRAVLRFKQGFGRLIRSSSDTGRVVVLDPRLVTTRYGRVFLEALPEGVEMRRVEEEF